MRWCGRNFFYFDIFGIETLPLFLINYFDLGSDMRTQLECESFFGACCSSMNCCIDSEVKIKSALNILVIQRKCVASFEVCYCLCCSSYSISNSIDSSSI